MTRTGRFLSFAVVAAALAGAAYFVINRSEPQVQAQRPGAGPGGPGGGRAGGRGAMRDDGPVPVIAAPVRRADVPVYLDGVGTIRALNTVTVRPQVEGRLTSVGFKEGEDVKRGQVLARIDPVTYQAQLDQAVAKKAQDEATLANARIDEQRYVKLTESNSVARQQLDTQRATVAQLEALVKFDQAVIDNARAMLAYTTIVAPIDGRTGLRQVDEGNVVRASDANGIVVITQVKPISVLFTLPQQQLGDVNRAFAGGPLAVDAFGADNKTVVEKGVLQVVDNQVDQTTGTVKLKAEFPNAELQLWPGQFINVRLLLRTLPQAVVTPTASVQRGPNGTFVYVVRSDDSVAVQPIKISMQDEAQAVIVEGLDGGERVVTTGFARLTAGARVTVTNSDSIPDPATQPVASEPQRERRPGGGQRRQQRSDAGTSVSR